MATSKFQPASQRGVDSVPTANSSNLVESGGVKSAIDEFQTKNATQLGGVSLNTITTGGTYVWTKTSSSGVTDAPATEPAGMAVIYPGAGDSCYQICVAQNGATYSRYRSATTGSWTAWVELATKSALTVTTFSMSAQNLSAIDFRGSMCNGYVYISIFSAYISAALVADTWLDIGTLPSSRYYPPVGANAICLLTDVNGNPIGYARMVVTTSGVVRIKTADAHTANTVAIMGATLIYRP